MSSRSSSIRSTGSALSRNGGGCSLLEGMNDRYERTASMHSSSEATSRSPTPDTRVWIREPPSSSWVTSSPVTALVR